VVSNFVTLGGKSLELDITAGVQNLNNLDEHETVQKYAVHTGKYLLVLQWRFSSPSSEWQIIFEGKTVK